VNVLPRDGPEPQYLLPCVSLCASSLLRLDFSPVEPSTHQPPSRMWPWQVRRVRSKQRERGNLASWIFLGEDVSELRRGRFACDSEGGPFIRRYLEPDCREEGRGGERVSDAGERRTPRARTCGEHRRSASKEGRIQRVILPLSAAHRVWWITELLCFCLSTWHTSKSGVRSVMCSGDCSVN
jgi:hypothetical protein